MQLDTVQINAQDPRRKALKEGFIQNCGWWAPFWDDFLALDVEMFEAFLEYGSVDWKKGHLAPKLKEFIHVASDCATIRMYEPGLRVHLRNAFTFGATQEEIMEVYELVATMGIHTVSMAVPILLEELRAAGQEVNMVLSDAQGPVPGRARHLGTVSGRLSGTRDHGSSGTRIDSGYADDFHGCAGAGRRITRPRRHAAIVSPQSGIAMALPASPSNPPT